MLIQKIILSQLKYWENFSSRVVLNIDTEKERVILQKALRENFETFEIPKIVNFEKNIQTNTNLKKSK